MSTKRRLFDRETQDQSLEDRYFKYIRPKLYEKHANYCQYGSRRGRTLAEHLDSACQFVLTITKIAKIPEDKRGLILSATSVHDLNKLDEEHNRDVKKLARDREFLEKQLEKACVLELVKTNEDLELVRKLIERHSGHTASDGMRFLPEDPNIKHWAAILIGGDLFDLGIDENLRIRKVENELTVALQRPTHIFTIRLSQELGYLTSLLLSACEEILHSKGLCTLALNPDSQTFIGTTFPDSDLAPEIAQLWQKKIDLVFGGNVEKLVNPTKDGIKIDQQAIEQNLEATLDQVYALLVKKTNSFKLDKITIDIKKYGSEAGETEVKLASELGLMPISNAEEFAISEGLKAVYLSYRESELSPKESWDRIATQVYITPEQRLALEPFNAQYGRCLFAAKAVQGGLESVMKALENSFSLRQLEKTEKSRILDTIVRQLLNLDVLSDLDKFAELTAYIHANPRNRCSLGKESSEVNDLISAQMPPNTKVQMFSNRLPGGMSAEPKRKANFLGALSYQLMSIGANFPSGGKQDPLYLHFALPRGSNVELRNIWRNFLKEKAAISEDGAITIDELKLYRDNELVFQPNKVVGMALPKRPEFIHSTVTIPIVWGDVNASMALLKSLRLALELSLALDISFPFVLSGNLEIEPTWDIFGQVEGIASSLQPLLGNGKYYRDGHLSEKARKHSLTAEKVLNRLRCLGQLTIAVASLTKKDDCLYDLARSVSRPLDLYYVLLRWILREQDEPNLEVIWTRIKEPLQTILEDLMSEEHNLVSQYLKKAAHIAEKATLRGSSFSRTSQAEPFSEFIKAVRARKTHLDWDTVFASLVQKYHNRLDRIRKHGVGATKFEQIKEFYFVLQQLFKDVYNDRPERLLTDSKTLEAAYLFFLQEARQELKAEKEQDKNQEN